LKAGVCESKGVPPLGAVALKCGLASNLLDDWLTMGDIMNAPYWRSRSLHRLSLLYVTLLLLPNPSAGQSSDDDPAGRAAHHLLSLYGDNSEISGSGLLDAYQQRESMIQSQRTEKGIETNVAGLTPGAWEDLGPDNIGGRVRVVAPHPTIPSRLYVGAASGGIWRTDNSGATWQKTDGVFSSLSVTSIVFSPSNSSVMFASTGEGTAGIPGAGIYKSIDGGLSWGLLPATLPSGNAYQSPWGFANRLAISPFNSGLLLSAMGGPYASTFGSGGLRRTTDGGITWAAVGPLDKALCDIQFDPHDATKIAAGGCASGGGIYLSSDSGLTWTQNHISSDRVELKYAQATPGVLYAIQNARMLYKSVNHGATFTGIGNLSGFLNGTRNGFYNNSIWVDPVDSNHLIVGAVSAFRSIDGGVNFSVLPGNTTHIGGVMPNMPLPHPDIHSIVSDINYDGVMNRRVYFGHDGGVSVAGDIAEVAAGNVNHWNSLTNGLAITQFYSVSGKDNLIVGGTQDNGTLRRRFGRVWEVVAWGDGGMVNVPRGNMPYSFGEIQEMTPFRTNLAASSNPSEFFCLGITESGCVGQSLVSLFIAPQVLDPNDDARIYSGGGIYLWVNEHAQDSIQSAWTPLYFDGWSAVSAIAVAKSNSNIVWVGEANGRVSKTTNPSATPAVFVQVTPLRPDSSPDHRGTILSILVDRVDPQIAYLTYGGYRGDNVVRTMNGGTTWQSIHGNLPHAPVHWIAQHPVMRSWLYVATEVGVFSSNNGGATWSAVSQGPSVVRVTQLSWANDWTLLASTYGRGIFRANTARMSLTANSAISPSTTVATSFGSMTVRLSDVDGSPIVGVPVQFAVSVAPNGSSASLSASQVVTNGSGLATIQATANTVASGQSGTYNVTATAPGAAAPLIFTMTNLPGPSASITVVQGSAQTTPVNSEFPQTLRVRVRDAHSNDLLGKPVTFSVPTSGASASLSSPSVNTDASGLAATAAFANCSTGQYSAIASTPGVGTTANFVLTNAARSPDIEILASAAGKFATITARNLSCQAMGPVKLQIDLTYQGSVSVSPWSPAGCTVVTLQPPAGTLHRRLECDFGTVAATGSTSMTWEFGTGTPISGAVHAGVSGLRLEPTSDTNPSNDAAYVQVNVAPEM
jgi:photosystem II stability/assembly factor-like uncharacterized protein